MRLLFTLTVALGLCGLVAALDEKKTAEDKKTEVTSVAGRAAAIEEEFLKALTAMSKDVRAAKTDEEKTAIREKFSETQPKFAERALALAEANLKDPGAVDAAIIAMKIGTPRPVGARATDLLAAHFADSPKLEPLLPRLGGPSGKKLLKAIHEKATDRTLKGAALYYTAAAMVEEADEPEDDAPPPAEKQAAAFKEAEALLARVAKEYGDVEVPGPQGDKETLTKAVEGQRFFINHLTVGKVLPDSACEDVDGKKVKISDYRGKVVVLDIWATWCGPCRAMIPHERELVKKLKDKPFAFISLSADEKKEELVKFLEKEPMPWVHWWNGDPKGGPVADYRVYSFPTIYVLDEKGVIRFKHVREKAMDEAVDALLKGLAPKG